MILSPDPDDLPYGIIPALINADFITMEEFGVLSNNIDDKSCPLLIVHRMFRSSPIAIPIHITEDGYINADVSEKEYEDIRTAEGIEFISVDQRQAISDINHYLKDFTGPIERLRYAIKVLKVNNLYFNTHDYEYLFTEDKDKKLESRWRKFLGKNSGTFLQELGICSLICVSKEADINTVNMFKSMYGYCWMPSTKTMLSSLGCRENVPYRYRPDKKP